MPSPSEGLLPYHTFELLEDPGDREVLASTSPESYAAYMAFLAVEALRLNRENIFLEERVVALKEETQFHPLTKEFGVYNKVALDERLIEISQSMMFYDRRATDPDALAVIYTDADNFKWINDEFSHEVGDEAIKELARVHTKAARNIGDIVGCDGGDEFVIGLVIREHTLTAEEVVKLWIERDRELCREVTTNRIARGGYPYNLSCTYGADIWRPDDPRHILDVKRQAERRMGKNKPPNRRR